MAKNATVGAACGERFARVLVKQAILEGGVRIAPVDLGCGKFGPVEAVLPAAVAEAHGPAAVEVLGEASRAQYEACMRGWNQAITRPNKQFTPPAVK